MVTPGEVRRLPAFFLLLAAAFLVAAGWTVAWRGFCPSGGTTVNMTDVAVSPEAVVVLAVINIGLHFCRHANARRRTVRLWVDGPLWIDVTDDDDGLPARRHSGIGLSSMRERAAERLATVGTRVSTQLPLPPNLVEEGT